MKKYLLFGGGALLVVCLDQATKAWILANMRLYEGFPVIEGFFNIVHVRNPGAAFGFLAGAAPVFRQVFFIAVTIAAIACILYYLRSTGEGETLSRVALSLILAGALGNLIDRIRFGEVIDFLDLYLGSYHWPAFNVADSAISVGAVLLALLLLRRRSGKPEDGDS